MSKKRRKNSNGYDMILDTYNSHEFPVIESPMAALVFPWNMQRDIDAIDSRRFYENTEADMSYKKNRSDFQD